MTFTVPGSKDKVLWHRLHQNFLCLSSVYHCKISNDKILATTSNLQCEKIYSSLFKICFSKKFKPHWPLPESLSPMQTDTTLLANNTQHCWTQQCCDLLRPFAWNHNNVDTCWHSLCTVWNRSNFWQNKSQHFYCSVTGEGGEGSSSVCMEPQQCWPHENVCARALKYIFQKTTNRSMFSSFWIVVNMVYQAELSKEFAETSDI